MHRIQSLLAWIRQADPSPGYLLLFINNYQQLQQAYGQQEFCKALESAFEKRLKPYGILRCDIVVLDQLALISLAGVKRKTLLDKNLFVERLRSRLCYRPIPCGSARVVCNVQVAWIDKAADVLSEKSFQVNASFKQVARSIAFAEAVFQVPEQTRSDMLCALRFLKALQQNRILLSFQPVFSITDGQVLYHETCLQSTVGESGQLVPCVEPVQAMERLHLIERLDYSVLWTVLETLETYPDICLACDVSVLSLQDSSWWKQVAAVLESRPDLAQRLIVKITEIITVFDMKVAVNAIEALRQFGCQIAINNMGTNSGTHDLARRIRPDIIKTDKAIMRVAREADGAHIFKLWVKTARQIGKCIVAEGVESESDFQQGVSVGAHAVQGNFMEKASIQPVWLAEPVGVQDGFSPA